MVTMATATIVRNEELYLGGSSLGTKSDKHVQSVSSVRDCHLIRLVNNYDRINR